MKKFLMVVEVEDSVVTDIENEVGWLEASGIYVKQLLSYQETVKHTCSCEHCLQLKQQYQCLLQEYADERAAHNEHVTDLLKKEKEFNELNMKFQTIMKELEDL